MAEIVPTDESQMIRLDTVRKIIRKGYRPLILALSQEGNTPGEISQVLEEEYGVEVSAQAIGHMLSSFKRSLVTNDHTARRDLAFFNQLVTEEMNFHREEYHLAKQQNDLKLMEHHQAALNSWASKYGKLVEPPKTMPDVAIQNNINLDGKFIEVLLNRGAEHPELVQNILKDLKGNEDDV